MNVYARLRPISLNGDVITIKPRRGTDRGYLLSRLKQQEPELFKRVARGELSAHAAAIQAGFRRKLSVLEQVRKLLPRLTPEECAMVADEALEVATEAALRVATGRRSE